MPILQEEVKELLEWTRKITLLQLSQILAQGIIYSDLHQLNPIRLTDRHRKYFLPDVGELTAWSLQSQIAELPIPQEDGYYRFFDLIVFFFEVAEVSP